MEALPEGSITSSLARWRGKFYSTKDKNKNESRGKVNNLRRGPRRKHVLSMGIKEAPDEMYADHSDRQTRTVNKASQTLWSFRPEWTSHSSLPIGTNEQREIWSGPFSH